MMWSKILGTYAPTVLISMSALGLKIQENLEEVIVVLLTGLVVVLFQAILQFIRKKIEHSKLDEKSKKELLDKLDETEEKLKELRGVKDGDEGFDKEPGTGDGNEETTGPDIGKGDGD